MKKKLITLLSLLTITIFSNTPIRPYRAHEKHVIGCCSNGFFSIFFGVLNHIAWCEKNNKAPVVYWGPDCLYYQPQGYNGSTNAWEYYFEPVSSATYIPGEFASPMYFAPDNSCMEFRVMGGLSLFNYIEHANRLIKKYIRIKPAIWAKAKTFFDAHMAGKATIGIHLRGTDKARECPQLDPLVLLNAANRYKNCQFFVATDEEHLLEQAKKMLKGPVIYYNSARSRNGKPVHIENTTEQALRGEEVLIEVLLLSHCYRFIHTASNVSAAVYFFNPQLHGTLFPMYGQPIRIEPQSRHQKSKR
jgi:hypothetical protein